MYQELDVSNLNKELWAEANFKMGYSFFKSKKYDVDIIQTLDAHSPTVGNDLMKLGAEQSVEDELNKYIDESITRSGSMKVHIIVVSLDQLHRTINAYEKPPHNKYHRICYIAWDFSKIPMKWMHLVKKCDGVWVPSTFVKNALIANLYKKPIEIVPFGYINDVGNDTDIFKKQKSVFQVNSIKISPLDVVFMTAFKYNTDFHRKNPIATVNAFKQSVMSSNFKKVLIIQTSKPKQYRSERSTLMNAIADSPNIILVESFDDKKLNKELLERANVYISLHRSEGFSYDVLQAMIMQKIVITTAYGGNLDFFVDDEVIRKNHYFIEWTKVTADEIYNSTYNFHGHLHAHNSSILAEPSLLAATAAINDAAKRIIRVFSEEQKLNKNNRKQVQESDKLLNVKTQLLKRYSAKEVGTQMVNLLSKIVEA